MRSEFLPYWLVKININHQATYIGVCRNISALELKSRNYKLIKHYVRKQKGGEKREGVQEVISLFFGKPGAATKGRSVLECVS